MNENHNHNVLVIKTTIFVSKQSGAVGACWAHNPEVNGSKPLHHHFFSDHELVEDYLHVLTDNMQLSNGNINQHRFANLFRTVLIKLTLAKIMLTTNYYKATLVMQIVNMDLSKTLCNFYALKHTSFASLKWYKAPYDVSALLMCMDLLCSPVLALLSQIQMLSGVHILYIRH